MEPVYIRLSDHPTHAKAAHRFGLSVCHIPEIVLEQLNELYATMSAFVHV